MLVSVAMRHVQRTCGITLVQLMPLLHETQIGAVKPTNVWRDTGQFARRNAEPSGQRRSIFIH